MFINNKDKATAKKQKEKVTQVALQPEVRSRNIFHELIEKKSNLTQLFDTKSKEFLNYAATAPAPSKDYCQIMVTFDEIIYRWWKISRRNDAEKLHPGEIKSKYDDFAHDENMQHQILVGFGSPFLNYIKNVIVHGHIDYLPRMPERVLLNIFSYLSIEEIAKLAQTNTFFQKILQIGSCLDGAL